VRAIGLVTLIRGNEAIISAFNPGWKNPNLYDDQVRGTAAIIAAIKKAGIKRVLWVGGAGGLEVNPGVRVIDSPASSTSASGESTSFISRPMMCAIPCFEPTISTHDSLVSHDFSST
jgi:hypothetical protein